ncbi:MAG: pilus assembly protein PilP [Desulfuromonadales bacterium]|nr:pilus assembly protein PilP [Desulfuromonadales bacterium]
MIIAITFVMTLLSACNKNEKPDTVAAPDKALAAKTTQQQAIPVQKLISSAIKLAPPSIGNQFDFSAKKDPFKPAIADKAVSASLPDNLKKVLQAGLPIHSFDVSQFKLIGIVTGSTENKAMVIDPNGKGYVLKTGMTIGKNVGRVTMIGAGGVDVVEQFRDDNGRVRKEIIRITLPRKQ